jgi:molybdopterin converting factor small subunit
MSIQVLFFGATADDVGLRSKRMIFSGEQSAAHVLERVITDHPSLRRHKLLFSVNQEYVSGDIALKDGDEVAIFTAVSGG